jgi:iron complex outermembrane receptor protein
VRIGNHDRFNYNVIANAPLVEDKLAFRFSYDAQKHDGWQRNVVGGYNLAQDDISNTIAKLLFRPTDDLELLLKLDQVRGDFRGAGLKMTRSIGGPALGGADVVSVYSGGTATSAQFIDDDYSRITENFKPSTDFDNKGAALTLNWDLGDDLAMKFIGAYRELNYSTAFDLDGTPYSILATNTFLEGHRQVSGELQFNGSGFDDTVDWTVGVYAFREEGRDGSDSGSPAAATLQATRGDVENKSAAVFGQATWQATDRLSLTLGLRYSEESKDLTSLNHIQERSTRTFQHCMVPSAFTGSASIYDQAGCNADFGRDDESVDYSFMANYDVNDDLMVYFKTATGFRSGGQNLRGGGTTPATVNGAAAINSFSSFEPETVQEYEVGFKGDFFANRLRLNMAYFYTTYDDIQRSTIVPAAGGGTATVVANAAAAKVQGIEAELTALLTEGWQLGASAGWTDASYDKYEDVHPLTLQPIDRSGEAFVATPDYNGSLWSTYTVALPLGELMLRLDYSWHDNYVSFATSTPEGVDSPAKGLVNARAQWDVNDNLSLALWGSNLTDEQYRVAGIEFYNSLGFAVGGGAEPRMYGLDITYRYGE